MNSEYILRNAVRAALGLGSIAVVGASSTAFAQGKTDQIEEVVVSGTRITVPGVTSSSPIYTVGAKEIEQLQQPEVEKIFRILPITLAADADTRNNGTAGAATISLRGLGPQRNLLMIDGKRLTPYNENGRVDTQQIPTALIERVDIITGGASAVYGSDAISGAINFIMKKNFEGIAIDSNLSQTGDSDGRVKSASVTLGSNVAEGRGNVVLSVNWSDRDGVQLGARPLGRLGIVTADGSGLSNFLSGVAPTAPPAGCGGPNAVAAGGSTTTLPTRVAIVGDGTDALGQFRDDGTLGANCSVFNFNPYNYYQTPQKRFGGTAIGTYKVNDHAEAYGRLGYSNTNVRQQVAPSGFFAQPFWTPLANPFLSPSAQALIISQANVGRLATRTVNGVTTPAPRVTAANWRDLNNNGVVDAADDLNISYRRRTVEFGERSTTYQNNTWNFVVGARGDIINDWNYDVSYQRGEADRTNLNSGYTNVANAALAVNAVSKTTCRSGGACVPINLFGGFGSITTEMAAFSSASALLKTNYTQSIASASVSGPVKAVKTPWADTPLALSFGIEYREETGESIPDECLKLAPASCLGGAGGNQLPIKGGFDVKEAFTEAIIPLATDHTGLKSLDLELGYRFSDYNPTGNNRTWKYGLSWRPVDQLLVRAMKQRAARAPNVGELASPQTTALDNATSDPCSISNKAKITAALAARCIATGMTAAQVGSVEDFTAGQNNAFAGTDLNNLPKPEAADTTTIGVVWTPSFEAIQSPVVSLDYYDINIKDYIGTFGSQEILDGCFVAGLDSQCSKIKRVAGGLTAPGSGIQVFTTNLQFLRAEGLELGASFGVGIGRFGKLKFSLNANKYLKQESRSSIVTPVIDCNGFYGNQCGNPLPKTRFIERTSWEIGKYEVSALWRHLGSTAVEAAQVSATFDQFRKIKSMDYIDLSGAWHFSEKGTVRLSVNNVLDKDPPAVGNEAGTTSTNSGNTFPGVYDTLGRVVSLGVNLKF